MKLHAQWRLDVDMEVGPVIVDTDGIAWMFAEEIEGDRFYARLGPVADCAADLRRISLDWEDRNRRRGEHEAEQHMAYMEANGR